LIHFVFGIKLYILFPLLYFPPFNIKPEVTWELKVLIRAMEFPFNMHCFLNLKVIDGIMVLQTVIIIVVIVQEYCLVILARSKRSQQSTWVGSSGWGLDSNNMANKGSNFNQEVYKFFSLSVFRHICGDKLFWIDWFCKRIFI